MLWHGSRITNFYGILSHGLKIAPPEAPIVRKYWNFAIKIIVICIEYNFIIIYRLDICLVKAFTLRASFHSEELYDCIRMKFLDASSKSANYSLSDPNQPGLMLLSEVALGNMHKMTQADDKIHKNLPSEKNSVLGIGRWSPNPGTVKIM